MYIELYFNILYNFGCIVIEYWVDKFFSFLYDRFFKDFVLKSI